MKNIPGYSYWANYIQKKKAALVCVKKKKIHSVSVYRTLQHSTSPPRGVCTEPIVSVSGIPSACSTATKATRPRQQLALIHHPSLSDGGLHYKALQYKLYWSGAEKKKKKGLHRLLNHCFTPILHRAAVCTTELKPLTFKIWLRLFDPKTLQRVPGLISEYDLTVSHFHKQTTAFIKRLSAVISLKAGLNLAGEVNRAPKWIVTLTTAIISGELLSISSDVAALPLWNETSSNVNWKGNSFPNVRARLHSCSKCRFVLRLFMISVQCFPRRH